MSDTTGEGWTGSVPLPAAPIMPLLALVPLLVLCQTFSSGLGMAMIILLLLPPACVTIFFMRRLIPLRTRLPWLLIVSTSWTTVLQMLFEVVAFGAASGAGVYVSLAACNCVVLFEMEASLKACNCRRVAARSTLAAVHMALLIVFLSALREILSTGAVSVDLPRIGIVGSLHIMSFSLPLFATAAGILLLYAGFIAAAAAFLPRLGRVLPAELPVAATDARTSVP